MIGAKFNNRLKNQEIFQKQQPFTDIDLDTLPIRVKHMVNFKYLFIY